MTETKMLKILKNLAENNSKDFGVFYLIDTWQQDPSKRVREIITIDNLIQEFTEKNGRFYKQYKVTSMFNKLVKYIENKQELTIKVFYKDTYEKFMNDWKEKNPGKDYYVELNNRKKQYHKHYLKYMGSFGLFGSKLIYNNF